MPASRLTCYWLKMNKKPGRSMSLKLPFIICPALVSFRYLLAPVYHQSRSPLSPVWNLVCLQLEEIRSERERFYVTHFVRV